MKSHLKWQKLWLSHWKKPCFNKLGWRNIHGCWILQKFCLKHCIFILKAESCIHYVGGFKTYHDKVARLFAFTMYFSLADSVVLQHLLQQHCSSGTCYLPSAGVQTRGSQETLATLQSLVPRMMRSLLVQSSLINLIDLHCAIQTPWLQNGTNTQSYNTGPYSPLNLLKYHAMVKVTKQTSLSCV